jgi:hypothetical protein
MRLTISYLKLWLVNIFVCLAVGLARNGIAQTTNSIPPNVFLTDNGFLFWYKPSGERLINLKKIEEAKKLPECRPAQQDAEGHWGLITNGFQLSLRFKKIMFTNGESIMATILIRNVTNQPEDYFRPTHVIANKDGMVLKIKGDTDLKEITMLPKTTVFPHTQQMYQVDLTQIYSLNESGEYVFQAECNNPKVTSEKVSVMITSVPVSAP